MKHKNHSISKKLSFLCYRFNTQDWLIFWSNYILVDDRSITTDVADFLTKTVYFIGYIEAPNMGPEISQVKGTITSKKIFMENASQTMNSLV